MNRILVALIATSLVLPAFAMAQEPQKTEKSSKKKTTKDKKNTKKKAGEPKAQ